MSKMFWLCNVGILMAYIIGLKRHSIKWKRYENLGNNTIVKYTACK